MTAAAAVKAITWNVATREAGSVEWGTPPAIYLPLDREFDFTLDVAASPGNAKHVRFLTRDVDALGVSWEGERVFCNPPYGRQIAKWMEKGVFEAREHAALSCFLVPARTGTKWFHRYVLKHAEIRFIEGRLSYTLNGVSSGKSGRAPFDSMVVIFHPGLANANGREQLLFPFTPRVI